MSKWFVGQQVRCYNEDAIIVSLRKGENTFKGEFEIKYADGDLVIVHPDELTPISVNPIRTITRREIVPGKYGRVMVEKGYTDKTAHVGIAYEYDTDVFCLELNANELREAAHVLNQLAEVLEDE